MCAGQKLCGYCCCYSFEYNLYTLALDKEALWPWSVPIDDDDDDGDDVGDEAVANGHRTRATAAAAAVVVLLLNGS